MGEKIRIDKFLSGQNLGSRKDMGKLIRAGQVTVDGIPVTRPEFKLDPEASAVAAAGAPVQYYRHLYLMMNKPEGVLSAARDRGTRTVVDLVPPALRRRDLFPAGRLDKDTTGLLILTDDGDFAHRMLAPKSGVYKLYKARLDAPLFEVDKTAFANGIESGEDRFLPAQLTWEAKDPQTGYVLVCEGKFHQVKRMFAAVGKTVVSLQRLRIGSLILDEGLPQGEVRQLTEEEIQLVFRQFD